MNIDKIVELAHHYVGETEKPNNSGFNDPDFEERMKDVGWQRGQSWCVYDCELIWREANPELDKVLASLFSGSALQTLNNFKAAGWKVDMVPVKGGIAIWKHGRGPMGHAATIVDPVIDQDGTFGTAEGNTNDKGGREGYIHALRRRKLNAPFSIAGLNLAGIIHPEPPESVTSKLA